MTNPYTHAALAKDRQQTLLAEADRRRVRQQARSGVRSRKLQPRRWLGQVGARLVSEVNNGTLRPLASEIPTVTAREPSLAAWIDSLTQQTDPHRDTTSVLIRPIESSDSTLLADGFARLSVRSRQLRFLGAKRSLSPAELDYLTHVDHRAREALVAVDRVDGRGIGVARYIRDPRDPRAAEIAVTVIDEWQRQGIGRQLLTRLITRAQDEGIRRFTALVTNDNVASINLLHSLNLEVAVLGRDLETTEYEVTLQEEESP